MAKKKADQAESPEARAAKAAVRYVLRALPVALLLVGAVLVLHQVEAFLVDSPRFQLGSADSYGEPNPNVAVFGIQHASEERVMSVFAEDAGRSVYLLPIAERRRRLLAVDWVRDASLVRLWPDRLEVRLTEREPVAFVQLDGGAAGRGGRIKLIDDDGVILEPPPRVRYDLPVLAGISEDQPEPMRALRVKRMREFLDEIGPHAEQISEIDASDPKNLRVMLAVEGRAVTLIVGGTNYLSRLLNFLAHYAEIQRRLPAASTFDLRLDDRITAVNEPRSGA